jgi:Flp pilus assembly protein TadD
LFRCAVTLVLLAASILPRGEVAASDPCAGVEPALELTAKALDEGRWDDADRSLQPLAMSHPECSRVILDLARLRAAQNNPTEAERLFSRALTLAPDDAAAHALFARFQLARGLGPQAAYLTGQSLAIDPDCPGALVVQGQILGRRGNLSEARASLERAVAVDPTNFEAHYELGVWFFRINRFDLAAQWFEAAIALRPQRTQSRGYLAMSLEMLGENERAEHVYREALQANSFLLKQGRLGESLPHLDRAAALHPLRRGPRYQRARLYLARGDYESARQNAERALALGKPGDNVIDLQVYYLLATIYSRLGETELAKKHAELARTTEIPEHADDLRRR